MNRNKTEMLSNNNVTKEIVCYISKFFKLKVNYNKNNINNLYIEIRKLRKIIKYVFFFYLE